jgi:hypothetical protein
VLEVRARDGIIAITLEAATRLASSDDVAQVIVPRSAHDDNCVGLMDCEETRRGRFHRLLAD